MAKAFVLHSGGLDSTTCLGIAVEHFGHEHVHSISINYGQRHIKEIIAADLIARHYHVLHYALDLHNMPKSMLTDMSEKVPDISYKDIVGLSPTYVPFRNGSLLARIAADASAYSKLHDNEDITIYFGAHAEDAAGGAYPDCSLPFVGAMANAIEVGCYGHVHLVAPLLSLYKSDIVRWGDNLKVPFEMTWSCYKGEELHCGTCPTCRSRKEAFINAGVVDPTVYAA